MNKQTSAYNINKNSGAMEDPKLHNEEYDPYVIVVLNQL